jgi:dihydroorotase
VHHLWFSDKDYERLDAYQMESCHKTEQDKKFIKALLDDPIDIITTIRTSYFGGKAKPYFQSMSGAPMVQHSLNCMLEFYKQELISLEKIVEKCAIILLYSIV